MIKDRAPDILSRSGLVLLLSGATVLLVGCASFMGSGASTLHCPDSVQAKVSAAQPTVHVSYTEPSFTLKGNPLVSLAKTSIYYDLGNGRTLAKEVPATRSSGGGEISETITVAVASKDAQSVKICVTATDRDGNESRMTP
ncbi:MAG: hypothetical protein P0119_02815 [Nitrospira sp.]|nr:hypothetical protein [Nitrospira sp.]